MYLLLIYVLAIKSVVGGVVLVHVCCFFCRVDDPTEVSR